MVKTSNILSYLERFKSAGIPLFLSHHLSKAFILSFYLFV